MTWTGASSFLASLDEVRRAAVDALTSLGFKSRVSWSGAGASGWTGWACTSHLTIEAVIARSKATFRGALERSAHAELPIWSVKRLPRDGTVYSIAAATELAAATRLATMHR